MPLPWTKIPKVGVALALIVVVTLIAGDAKQAPVPGLVSQIKRFTGILAPPVSADAVILALTPELMVATANAPVPFVPGMFTMPSLVVVAVKATMSGAGVFEAEKSKVSMPGIIEAGLVFVQSKLNLTSVGGIGALGVKANT